jgi:Bax inhibitor 1
MEGLTLGPLIELYLLVNPGMLFNAMGATAIIFACFSISVLYSSQRQGLYVAGLLSSAISSMFWIQIANWWMRSSAMYTLELWLGLMVFRYLCFTLAVSLSTILKS